MKHIIRILVLAVTLVIGLTTISAQTVQVQLFKRVSALPATVTSYLDDPFHYFTIQFIVNGAGAEGLDIYFDMDMTVDADPVYVRTRPDILPLQPIHLTEGVNIMKAEVLNTQVLNRTETNFDYSDIINAQQLPEGTYSLCVDIYRWSDRFDPNPQSISTGPCPTFDICYSGSAPELASPLAGAQINMNGAMVVKPTRKISFLWTPVISNCSGSFPKFKYTLKVVKVLNGQNYNDAIKRNPTVLSTEVNNNNYAVFDTLVDIKVRMEKGALYVAQVQATQTKTNNKTNTFIISNEGNSQPLPFFWGDENDDYGSMNSSFGNPYSFPSGIPNGTLNRPTKSSKRTFGYVVDDESEEGSISEGVEGLTVWEGGVEDVSELETIQDEMKKQYLSGFVQDADAVASLTYAYPEEQKYVPTPKRRYVESDGYYTVPMTDDLDVSFMPTRHQSLKKVSYAIELYENVEGGIDSITAYEPLFREDIVNLPERYNKMDSHELVKRTLAGKGTELEQGHLYYLQLSCFYTVDYWKYSIADTSFYVNDMLAEHIHDTVSRNKEEEELTYSNGVLFQWGDNPEIPNLTTPQWKTPVNRTGDDIYDPANYVLPTKISEVQKSKAFPVSWTPVKDVAKGDKVVYEVNVYELKPDQTIENALLSNEALVSRALVDTNEISEKDTDFFKVFNPKKTYVMTLSTNVYGESKTYHFENGKRALPIVFTIVK